MSKFVEKSATFGEAVRGSAVREPIETHQKALLNLGLK